MSALFGVIAIPLGWIMKACYLLVKNYGIALILFTVIIRVILLPLNIKQQKSSARMAKLQPQLQKLQKKYANNKEKYQEEMMALYAKENASPTAGCLPMLITMLVLFALIEVVYNPLYYVTDVNKEDLNNSNTLISNLYSVSYELDRADTDDNTFAKLLETIEKENEGISEDEKYKKLQSELEDIEKIEKLKLSDKQWERVISAVKLHNDIDTGFMLNEDYITPSLAKGRPALLNFSFLNKAGGKYADVIDIVDDSGKLRETIDDFDYTFFGIKLESFPKWNNLLVLVPVLSFVFQLLMTFVSQYFTKKNNPAAANAMGGMKIMLYIMPIFSLIITFNFPVGLGIYWVMSSIVGLGQTVFLNMVYTPEHVEELIKKEDAKKKKSGKKSFMERALEAQQQGLEGRKSLPDDSDDDDEEETEEKKLSKAQLRELQRKKLNEARKRMAEKYGDEYKEE
ncbi:MAG: YidC/Oxa1 family membrane protein insertase [Ruminococcus sp.]|nr:YidC/Oxa1 family membrane protein insertase [Ruminococcus sp.]